MANDRIDLHIHTHHSPDGHCPVSELCEAAVHAGIGTLAFTDHCDFTPDYEKLCYTERAVRSLREVSETAEAYAGSLTVIKGIELGEPLHFPEKTAKLDFSGYDMILGSTHNLKGKPDFKAVDYENVDISAYLDRYFDELLRLSGWDGVDVIAHLTLPLRYITGRKGIPVELRPFDEKIDAVLETIVRTGKALEVNTSELFGSLGRTMPDEGILERFRRMGGERVTIGSDAHFARDVGRGIDEALSLVRRLGFDRITYFIKREPCFVRI